MIVMVFACSSFVDLISDESDWEKDADIQRVLQESVVDTGCQSSRYFYFNAPDLYIFVYLCLFASYPNLHALLMELATKCLCQLRLWGDMHDYTICAVLCFSHNFHPSYSNKCTDFFH